MFEKIVADALSDRLGAFLELDPESIRTSVWDGCLELRDVQLKPSAFASLGVPVELVGAFVGLVKVEIPWRRLGQAPVKVLIDSVLACVRLREQADVSDDAVMFNRAALAADEAAWKAAGDISSGSQQAAPPNSLFVQKIIDNMEFHLTNMHLRFEDHLSRPASPFALGVTLDCMSMHSADGEWTEKFIETPMQVLNKVVKLGGAARWATEWCDWAANEPGIGMAMYVEPMSQGSLRCADPDGAAWRHQMREMVHPNPSMMAIDAAYILRPLSVAIRVRIDQHSGRGEVADTPHQPVYELTRTVPYSEPVVEAWLHVNEIAVVLEHDTAYKLASLGAWIARKDLPPAPTSRPGAGLGSRGGAQCVNWWRWAYNCVRRPRIDWTWDTLRRSCELRRSYAGANTASDVTNGSGETSGISTTSYCNVDDSDDEGFHTADEDDWEGDTSSSAESESERARLARIAQMTDGSASTNYSSRERRYGLYERRVGAETHSWLEPMTNREADRLQWIEDQLPVTVIQVWRRQALRHLDDEAKMRAAEETQTNSWWSRKQAYLGLSEQQMAFLRAEIGDWTEAAALSYPCEYIQHKLHLQMDKIQVLLRKRGRGASNGSIVELRCGSVQCTSSIREGSTTTEVKLRSLTVLDQCSAQTYFRKVIDKDPERCRDINHGSDGNWLDCVLEQNPIEDDTGERAVGWRANLQIAPLRVVLYPYLIETLLEFAQLGDDLQLVVAIKVLQASVAQLVLFVQQTGPSDLGDVTAQVVDEVDTRYVLDLDIMLHAPTILIPDDCSRATASCVRLCLGELKLTTGIPSDTHDNFAADVTNLQVDICDVHGSTNTTSNCRQVLGRSGSVAVIIKTKARTCMDSSVAHLDIHATVSPFTANVSDDLLVSMDDIVSAMVLQRQAVLADLMQQSGASPNIGMEAVVTDSSIELEVSVEFEGINFSVGGPDSPLAVLELDMLKIAVVQTHGKVLTGVASVRTLVLVDKCSLSKERIPHLISRHVTDMSSSQVGADLFNVTMEKTGTKLGLMFFLEPLRIIYNPKVTERLLNFGQYVSRLGQSLSRLQMETGRGTGALIGEVDVQQVLEVDVATCSIILVPDDSSKASLSCARLRLDDVKLRVHEFDQPSGNCAITDVHRAEFTNLRIDLCDLQCSTASTCTVSNFTKFIDIPLVIIDISKPVPPQQWGAGVIAVQLRSLDEPIVVHMSNRLCEVLRESKQIVQNTDGKVARPSRHSTPEPWTCTACTFANGGALSVCAMCKTPRAVSDAVAGAMQLKIDMSSSMMIKWVDMASANADLPPFSPPQHYMLRGEVMRLYLKELSLDASVHIKPDAISGILHIGSLQHLCSIAVSDTRLQNAIRHLAGTNLEMAQVALGVDFVVPRADRSVPMIGVDATIGAIRGNINDVFLINANAILSNLTVWYQQMFSDPIDDGDEATFGLQHCKFTGPTEHAGQIQLAITFERKTAWTWHTAGEESEYVAIEKYIEPATLHRSRGWELQPFNLPPRIYSSERLQQTFVDVIAKAATGDGWAVVSEQLLPRLLNGELRLGHRDWNFAAVGFEPWALAKVQLQRNRTKAIKQATDFVALCGESGNTAAAWVEWEAWLHSLCSEEISPGYQFGNATGAVLGGVIGATEAAIDGVLDAGAALVEGRPMEAASHVVGGSIGAAQAAVGGAARATESVLGGVVHGTGSVISALLGSSGEEAKWIWADAGKVGWVGLASKHRLARETYSLWSRGTFVEIEADLRRKRGSDATRGVELQFVDHRTGTTIDKSFETPLQCAEWIALRIQPGRRVH